MPIKKVVLSMRQYGQLCQTRFYLNTAELGWTDAQLAEDLRVNFCNWYKNLMVNDVLIFNINVSSVGPGAQTSLDLPVSILGANTGEPQRCPFMTWVIRLNTGLAGKKFRGRMYPPGPRQGDFQQGVISSGGVAASNAVLTQLNQLYTFNQAGGRPYLVIHGEAESHDTPVILLTMRGTMGCQRRRNIGVGA